MNRRENIWLLCVSFNSWHIVYQGDVGSHYGGHCGHIRDHSRSPSIRGTITPYLPVQTQAKQEGSIQRLRNGLDEAS